MAKIKRTRRAKPKKRAAKRKKIRAMGSKGVGTKYRVDQSFELFKELRSLIVKAVSGSFPDLERKLKRLGRIKLAVATGAFLNINDSRVDLLLVGDNIQLKRLTNIIKDVESVIGKEIRYVILSVLEFKYRYEMYDRFLRDILDAPHEKIIKRIKI